jgi:hypothetical protein
MKHPLRVFAKPVVPKRTTGQILRTCPASISRV